MNKNMSRLMALLLVFVMVFAMVPAAFAQEVDNGEGEIGPADPRMTFNVKVTANQIEGIVDGTVQFMWRAKTVQDKVVVEEAAVEPTAVISTDENSEATIKVERPTTIDGEELNKLQDIELVVYVNKAEIDNPVLDVEHEINLKDDNNNYRYQQIFALEDLAPAGVYNVLFNIDVFYKALNNDDFVLWVVDAEGQPVKEKEVNAYAVRLTDDGSAYLLDANGDYLIDTEEFQTIEAKTDYFGRIILTEEQQNALLNELETAVIGFQTVDKDSNITFVNFAEENYKAVLVVRPAATNFEVEVREYYEVGQPFRASEGATVKIVKNVGKLFEEPAMGEVLASAMTNQNGKVWFKNIALTNDVYYNLPWVYEEDMPRIADATNENYPIPLEPIKMIRRNYLVVEKEGYDTVERMIKWQEMRDKKALVVLNQTGLSLNFVDRIQGENRYETAVNIAKQLFPEGLTNQTVILASGQDFADALVANGLTYSYEAPILLTQKGQLAPETRAYLAAEKAAGRLENVIIMGGINAIVGNVEATLRDEIQVRTFRIGGEDRFETATMVFDKMNADQNLGAAWGIEFNERPTDEVLMANAFSFADALIASLPSAQYGKPIVLTAQNAYNPTTKAYLEANSSTVKKVTFIGGPAAISEDVYGSVNIANKDRLYGNNRYLTSLDMLGRMYADATKLYVVAGNNYADALVAGRLAADNNAAILLVDPNALEPAAKDYLMNSKITDITIIGGVNAVSAAVQEELNKILLQK